MGPKVLHRGPKYNTDKKTKLDRACGLVDRASLLALSPAEPPGFEARSDRLVFSGILILPCSVSLCSVMLSTSSLHRWWGEQGKKACNLKKTRAPFADEKEVNFNINNNYYTFQN